MWPAAGKRANGSRTMHERLRATLPMLDVLVCYHDAATTAPAASRSRECCWKRRGAGGSTSVAVSWSATAGATWSRARRPAAAPSWSRRPTVAASAADPIIASADLPEAAEWILTFTEEERMSMKLFVDTANLEELEQCLKRGFPAGVTTNPSILSSEQPATSATHINDMIALLAEVRLRDPAQRGSLQQPTGGDAPPGRGVCRPVRPLPQPEHQGADRLERAGGDRRAAAARHRVNCTCCMSYNQAIMAARAGRQLRQPVLGPHPRHRLRRRLVVRQVHQTLARLELRRRRSSSAASATSPTSTRPCRPAPTS